MNELVIPLIKRLCLTLFLLFYGWFAIMCASDTEADLKHSGCKDRSRAVMRRAAFGPSAPLLILYEGKHLYLRIYVVVMPESEKVQAIRHRLELHHEKCFLNFTPQYKD